MKGPHTQVFDLADAEPAAEPPPLRLPRNYLDGFRDLYTLECPEVRTIVGMSGHAFPVNAFRPPLGKVRACERSKIIDPVTEKPAVRNVFRKDECVLALRSVLVWWSSRLGR